MGKKRSVAGSFAQGPEHYKLGICNLIGRIAVVKNPDPVNQPADNMVEFFDIIKKIIPGYGYPPPGDIFYKINC